MTVCPIGCIVIVGGVGGATPLPLTVMDVGSLLALLATVTVPETAPAAIGEKMIFIVALRPAAICTGSDIPLALNPDPDTATCEMVTPELPMLMRTTDWVLVSPTVTLPKASEAG
jgi:hypothetical protein